MSSKSIVPIELEVSKDLATLVKELSGPVTEPSCKLCNSKFRKEAEELSETGTSDRGVFVWLTDKKEDISYNAVHNHLREHLRQQQDGQNLKSLASRLSKWGVLTHANEEIYNRYITALDMEFMTLFAENNKLSSQERRKNDELLIKIAQTVGFFKDQIHKLHTEMRPVEVVITSLNRIIQVKLEGTSSPEVKRVLSDIIDQLLRDIGDLPIDIKQVEEQ